MEILPFRMALVIDLAVLFTFTGAGIFHPLLPWPADTKLIAAAAVYLLGTTLDFSSTYVAVARYGLEVEQNPFLRHLAFRMGLTHAYIFLEIVGLALFFLLGNLLHNRNLFDAAVTSLLMLGGSHLFPGVLNFLNLKGYLR